MEGSLSTSEEYRRLALGQRQLAREAALPNVRALLAASADKWAFLAEIAAARENAQPVERPVAPRRARPDERRAV